MLADFRIVLVSPLYSGNIGSVARVAANFDVRDFVIVLPQCDPLSPDAQMFARGAAREFLMGAKVVNCLQDALSDCVNAVAFTRFEGARRIPQTHMLSLHDSLSPGGKTALVFGREDNGLTGAEAGLCSHLCSIPTSATMPSMNLSHSVAVALSTLYSQRHAEGGQATGAGFQKPFGLRKAATAGEVDELLRQWNETLIIIGLTKGGNPQRMFAHLQRIVRKAKLTGGEVRLLQGFLNQVRKTRGVDAKEFSQRLRKTLSEGDAP